MTIIAGLGTAFVTGITHRGADAKCSPAAHESALYAYEIDEQPDGSAKVLIRKP